MDTTEQAREQAGTKAGDAGRTAVDDEAVGPVPTGTYVVDPVHSSIGFAVVHNGVSTFRSGFGSYEARLRGRREAEPGGSGRRRQHRDRRGPAQGPPALPRVL